MKVRCKSLKSICSHSIVSSRDDRSETFCYPCLFCQIFSIGRINIVF
jgi:hypothetical protein